MTDFLVAASVILMFDFMILMVIVFLLTDYDFMKK